jgi:hypothetical protein
MKKNLIRIASIAMAAMATMFTLNSCGDDKDFDDEDGVPTITWESNPTFAAQEISDNMEVDLQVTSPNGIMSFVIKVTCPDPVFLAAMNAMVAEANQSSNNDGKVVLDLITDAKTVVALKAFGVPTGTDLLYKTSVELSLSNLFPMITKVATTEGNYIFEATVTDRNGNSVTKTLTFHLTTE